MALKMVGPYSPQAYELAELYAKGQRPAGDPGTGLSTTAYKILRDQNNPSFTQGKPAASTVRRTAAASGGGGADPDAALNAAAIDNTRKAIGSLDTELNTGYGNIDSSYNSLTGKYDKEAAQTAEDYDEQTVSNNKSLDKNRQNALLAAAQGRRGLRGTLSAIGALSGDGAFLADNAVRTSANEDIGGAVDTYATNATGLDKAKTRFDEEDRDRRKEAETARINQRTALEGAVAGKKQGFLQKMAELFGSSGNNGEATRYLNEAGDLNNVIAAKSAVAATPFAERKAAFTPGDLEKYLAGAGDMTVDVAGGGLGGAKPATLLAGRGLGKRKEEEELAV